MRSRREALDYLRDILEITDRMNEFIGEMSFEEFALDAKTNFAVCHALEVIGDAAKHVLGPIRQRHPEIPWRRMAGMRDRLIHGYFGVDVKIVWETATKLIPELKPKIAEVLEEESLRG
ncbi:MAG: DUF86 domain-containing protein [Candidatus Methanomethylicaceae archaeon]